MGDLVEIDEWIMENEIDVFSAYEIWKIIHYTNPRKLDERCNAETRFIRFDDVKIKLLKQGN